MPKSSKHMEEDLSKFNNIIVSEQSKAIIESWFESYDPKTSFKTKEEIYVPLEPSRIYPRVKPKLHRPNKFWSWLLRKFTTPSCIK